MGKVDSLGGGSELPPPPPHWMKPCKNNGISLYPSNCDLGSQISKVLRVARIGMVQQKKIAYIEQLGYR